MSSIDVVMWDFGGVFTASPFHAVSEYATSMGADPVQYREIVFGTYDVDGDHAWHRLERGEISMADAVAAIKAEAIAAGFDFDPREMFGSMRSSGGAQQAVVDAAWAQLEAGRRNAVLTNNVKEFSNGWRSLVPVDELFAEIIDSSEVGVRKPDPAIYQLAIERLGCPAERIVFLDDLEANVVAARNCGLQGIVVDVDPTAALDELRAITSR